MSDTPAERVSGVRVVGRVLRCVRCRRSLDVLEAATGARSDKEHRWINPGEYVCGGCLEAAGEVTTGALSAAAVAAGRARTAQERNRRGRAASTRRENETAMDQQGSKESAH